MLEFNASIFGGEVPVCLGVVGIALLLPGGDFVGEGRFVGNAAVEALDGQNAKSLRLDTPSRPWLPGVSRLRTIVGCHR